LRPEEIPLRTWLRRCICGVLITALATLGYRPASAFQTSQVNLDSSETLFAVLSAINACGYDAELDQSDPMRAQIRSEVADKIAASKEAQIAARQLCQFYQGKLVSDASHNLAEYVSLALCLTPPPALATKGEDAELPPDSSAVVDILPLLRKFYEQVGLHAIWERHAKEYAALTRLYHTPVAKMLFDTEIYLKLPSAGYLGRGFTVYLDPMGAPGQTNARNYGEDYYVVISPGKSGPLKMAQIRHTYLHYLLDPLALKYPGVEKRLDPLLNSVQDAPMDESFKSDASLLATECLIRAIEARSTGGGEAGEAERREAVQKAMEQGFILTDYFYDALVQFEKGPTGLRDVYFTMLLAIDLRHEQKKAAQIQFASTADAELLHLSRPQEGRLLQSAEQRLADGDALAARKLAQQALDAKVEDPGRALFILAQVATMNRQINEAQDYFEKALEMSHEVKVVAWSHIYLGRIFDLQEDRDAALDQYRAAATTGASLPEAKAAAEQGLQQPYEPPSQLRQ
jgi:tetratricopeptide (TPR) repeat protein